jgi:hypothetical protein
MPNAVLPYGRQTIEDDDIAAVAEALRADFLTTGPTVEAFERAFAETVGARHAVACANGTAALHLAMLALDVKPGEVVIAPSITFLATANCARYVGADVVFADVDADSGLMTPDTLAEALGRCRGASSAPSCPCTCAATPASCRRWRRWRARPARCWSRTRRMRSERRRPSAMRRRPSAMCAIRPWPPSRFTR